MKCLRLIEALIQKDIEASIIGELIRPKRRIVLVGDGKENVLEHPVVEPFWRTYYGTFEKQNAK